MLPVPYCLLPARRFFPEPVLPGGPDAVSTDFQHGFFPVLAVRGDRAWY